MALLHILFATQIICVTSRAPRRARMQTSSCPYYGPAACLHPGDHATIFAFT